MYTLWMNKHQCIPGKYISQVDGKFRDIHRSNETHGFIHPEMGLGGWERNLFDIHPVSHQPILYTYNYHESGLATAPEVYSERLHGRTTWPGFTLNPGVWDMTQIYHAIHSLDSNKTTPCVVLRQCNHLFRTGDRSFEHVWSVYMHSIGLSIGYLQTNYFIHLGESLSAYVLNDHQRIWDRRKGEIGKETGVGDSTNSTNVSINTSGVSTIEGQYLYTSTTLFD